MKQYSAFFLSLIAVAVLWGTENQPVIIVSLVIVGIAAVLSITSFAFAARVARDRGHKVAAGMKLRGAGKKDIRRERKAALKVREADYDFVPAWVTYAGMVLALVAILILGYALVIRFLL